MPKYWSGLPFPSPGDCPDPGIESTFAALHGDFFYSLRHQGTPCSGSNIHVFWLLAVKKLSPSLAT